LSTDTFAPRSDADIHRLVTEHPLAWVVSGFGAEPRATPLPIRPHFGPDGRLEQLLGHFAHSNPQLEGLRADPRALILFMGPQGYISPSWMSNRDWGPTWNYAAARFSVELDLVEDAEGIRVLLDDLIGAMEQGRPKPWRADELGPRYDRLARGIVGFRGRILNVRARFKLGQDERDEVFGEILAGLEASGSLDLRSWMADFAER
jgi:transcriptional regulator